MFPIFVPKSFFGINRKTSANRKTIENFSWFCPFGLKPFATCIFWGADFEYGVCFLRIVEFWSISEKNVNGRSNKNGWTNNIETLLRIWPDSVHLGPKFDNLYSSMRRIWIWCSILLNPWFWLDFEVIMETIWADGDAANWNIVGKRGRFHQFGLKNCQPVYVDEENLNMMSDSSESLILIVLRCNYENNRSRWRRNKLKHCWKMG